MICHTIKYLLLFLIPNVCCAAPPIYIALNNNIASQQIRNVLKTNYIALGSDRYHYFMDEYKNSILNKAKIIVVEFPDHNEIFCPAVKIGEFQDYQPLPEGHFPEADCWLWFFHYLVDIYDYDNRVRQWKREYTVIQSSILRHWYNETHDCDYCDDYETIYMKYKYVRPNQPLPIPSPIPWEYK